jgi:hypothetical protein
MVNRGMERGGDLGVRAIRIANGQQDEPVGAGQAVPLQQLQDPQGHVASDPQVTRHLAWRQPVDDHHPLQVGCECERNARSTSPQLFSTSQS